jgi:hypothetical protein
MDSLLDGMKIMNFHGKKGDAVHTPVLHAVVTLFKRHRTPGVSLTLILTLQITDRILEMKMDAETLRMTGEILLTVKIIILGILTVINVVVILLMTPLTVAAVSLAMIHLNHNTAQAI